MKRCIRAAAAAMMVVIGSGPALAGVQPPAEAPARQVELPPGHTAPGGAGRIVRTEVILDTTPEAIWALLSTPDGLKTLWSVARAEVDLRPGGRIRAAYEEDESTGWITHHILALEPGRVLAFRTDPPPKAPPSIQLICQTGWTVMRLEPAGPGRTRLTESMMGFGDGPLYDEAYAFFEKGNAWTAEQMRKKFGRPADADAADRAWALLERLASGGEWVTENAGPGGKVFRVRNVIRPGPAARSFSFRGWLGMGEGMLPHSSGVAWREPTGEIWHTNLDESGGRAGGRVTAPDDNTLEWEWDVLTGKGESHRYAVRFTFDGPDAYRGVISSIAADGERKVVVDAVYRRVDDAGFAFHELAKSAGGGPGDGWVIDGAKFPAWGEFGPGVVKEAVFDGTPEEAFRAFSTSAGWKAAMGVESNIDLRVGGPYEIYFSMEPPPGERGSEGCRVLAYLPGRMLCFSWNAPPQFPNERAQRAWVVLTFTPSDGGKTAVRLEHTGFGDGGRWPEVRAYFDRAWGMVMEAFRSRAASGAVR